MRKTGFLLLLAVALAAPASGQSKTSGNVHCAKADPDYTLNVADGHVLTLNKSACTWSDVTPTEGVSLKSGEDFTSGEMHGAMGHSSGYHVAKMDNGDTVVVHFAGEVTAAKDQTAVLQGKWSYVSGTGKMKGIKGGGTFKGTANADGTSEAMVVGTYTLPTATPGKAK
jgi:hypothetical protein